MEVKMYKTFGICVDSFPCGDYDSFEDALRSVRIAINRSLAYEDIFIESVTDDDNRPGIVETLCIQRPSKFEAGKYYNSYHTLRCYALDGTVTSNYEKFDSDLREDFFDAFGVQYDEFLKDPSVIELQQEM